MTDRGVMARKSQVLAAPGGMLTATTVWTTAHVARSAASGDARFQTTFTYSNGRRLRCDSGFVHWAADRSGAASGAEQGPDGGFGPVASLAAAPSPAQLRFAEAVDATCSTTYRQGELRQLRRSSAGETPDKQEEGAVEDHQLQYLATTRLGAPPADPRLYRSWLANMQERIALEKRALSELISGHRLRSELALDEMDFLKVEGDWLGQEFGLRICTSNGPLHSARPSRAAPVASSDGAPSTA